jgi:hypothetical protein
MKKKTIIKKYKFDNLGSTKASKTLAKKREKRIKKIAHILPLPASLVMLEGNSEKLPFLHFWIGLRQYVFGYYENTILNSAFAAEYAVLLRLNEKLGPDQKKAISIKGLSFSGAINKAKNLSLIDEECQQDLTVLCNLRNMAAHPSNWITLYNLLDQQDSVFDSKWIAKIIGKKPEEIEAIEKDSEERTKLEEVRKQLLSYKEKKAGHLPDLEWAAHRSTLEAQTLIVKKYSEKMVKDFFKDGKISKLIERPKEAAKLITKNYPYPEELAFRAIGITVATLKQLKFLT